MLFNEKRRTLSSSLVSLTSIMAFLWLLWYYKGSRVRSQVFSRLLFLIDPLLTDQILISVGSGETVIEDGDNCQETGYTCKCSHFTRNSHKFGLHQIESPVSLRRNSLPDFLICLVRADRLGDLLFLPCFLGDSWDLSLIVLVLSNVCKPWIVPTHQHWSCQMRMECLLCRHRYDSHHR